MDSIRLMPHTASPSSAPRRNVIQSPTAVRAARNSAIMGSQS